MLNALAHVLEQLGAVLLEREPIRRGAVLTHQACIFREIALELRRKGLPPVGHDRLDGLDAPQRLGQCRVFARLRRGADHRHLRRRGGIALRGVVGDLGDLQGNVLVYPQGGALAVRDAGLEPAGIGEALLWCEVEARVGADALHLRHGRGHALLRLHLRDAMIERRHIELRAQLRHLELDAVLRNGQSRIAGKLAPQCPDLLEPLRHRRRRRVPASGNGK